MWDAVAARTIQTHIILALSTADVLGMTETDWHVGHHGAHGCRLGCLIKGRHKPHTGHYFAVHLKPVNYTVHDCNHPDFQICDINVLSCDNYEHNLFKVVASTDQTDYERNCKETRISKPSILSGLVTGLMFSVPCCFPLDLMHLLFINLGELLIPLWRGTLQCDSMDDISNWDWAKLTGDVWQSHGQLVTDARPFFPSSFHCPPCNPAEKISSGYEATEYYHYLFRLRPGYFHAVLPLKYWKSYCRLVHSVRIITQQCILGTQLQEAHLCLVQFVEEYELLYYQCWPDCIHFCQPCIHTLLHACPEVIRVGSEAYSTQIHDGVHNQEPWPGNQTTIKFICKSCSMCSLALTDQRTQEHPSGVGSNSSTTTPKICKWPWRRLHIVVTKGQASCADFGASSWSYFSHERWYH